MLKKKTPETIATVLRLKGQGEEFSLPVTYRNLKQKEYDALVTQAHADNAGDLIKSNAFVALGLITEWGSEYDLTLEGLIEANDDWPYLLVALVEGFFMARQVERVKN